MLLTIFNICSLLGISQAFFLPSPDVCVSIHESLNCICTKRENITISTNLNFGLKEITVKGCGIVSVPLGAITHLELETLTFRDLDTLDILPFALVGVQTINMLKIENISNFTVRQHGFVGLFNVTNIIIRNVTANSLPVGSFGDVSNVNKFLIERSSFLEVQETAFIVTNVSSFTVFDCKFSVLENVSFLIHNADSVTFENCEIYETSNNSFSMSFVTSVSFLNCHFGVLATTSILTRFLERFSFQKCIVEELESDVFSLVDAEKILFTHNTIKITDEYSLIPSTGTYSSKNVEIEDCCNSFTCDCNIYWMWQSNDDGDYDSLLDKSYCIDEPETNLSAMVPVLDSSGRCMTLELKIYGPALRSSTETIISNGQNRIFDLKLVFFVVLFGKMFLMYPL